MPLLSQSLPLVIYGSVASKKNLFIAYLSYLTAVQKECNFNVHYLNVDCIEPTILFNSRRDSRLKKAIAAANNNYIYSNNHQNNTNTNNGLS